MTEKMLKPRAKDFDSPVEYVRARREWDRFCPEKIEPLPLDVEIPCVRCGMCCQVAPCAFGRGAPCVHLEEDPAGVPGQHLCARHGEIERHEEEHGERFRMFGTGCSSNLFNTLRTKVTRRLAYDIPGSAEEPPAGDDHPQPAEGEGPDGGDPT